MTSTRGAGGTPTPPVPPAGRIELRPLPPSTPAEGVGGLLMNALPLLGSLGSVGLVVTMGGGSGGRAYLAAGLFLATTLGFVVVQVERQRTLRGQRVGDARAGYLRHLAGVRADVRDAAERQRQALRWHHPEPAALPALAAERSRVWGGPVAADGSLPVRYAVGEQPLAVQLHPAADDAPERADPVAVAAQQRLLAVHATQAGLPLVLDLRTVHRLDLCGAPAAVRDLARAIVCSAAAAHAPGRLAVAVLCAGPARAEWEWVKWLPHARSDRARDALGRRRMVATGPDELAALLPAALQPSPAGPAGLPPAPHLLLVVDGEALPLHPPWPSPGAAGVTVLATAVPGDGPPGPGTVRLRLDEEPDADGRHPLRALRAGEQPVPGRADRCDAGTAEALARRLAAAGRRHRRTRSGVRRGARARRCRGGRGAARAGGRARPRPRRLLAAPTAPRPAADPDRRRPRRPPGAPGPQGVRRGRHGAARPGGRCDRLRQVRAAAHAGPRARRRRHSPEELNLVLVDFKGGATFAGMAPLPHVSALITNLEEELTLVDRMEDALAGELVRRQALLRRAGNLASVRDHRRAPGRRGGLPPLPALVVVVDEFSELLAARPEFVACSRPSGGWDGRSACTSSWPPSGWRRAGCAASRPTCPTGSGCARSAPASPAPRWACRTPTRCPPSRGSACYAPTPRRWSGSPPATSSGPASGRPRRAGRARAAILPFTAAAVPGPPAPEARAARESDPGDDGPSLLDVAVGRLAGHGPGAHRVWLPPLDVPDTLDALMDDLVVDPRLGLVSPAGAASPGWSCRSVRSTGRATSAATPWASTWPARAATSRWSAGPAAARARCCARSSRASR